MKEKIEALIREIGIDEVEAILNQMKSKINVKENLKRDFIKLLSGCTISFLGDDIEYRKDRKLLFFYNKKKNRFYFDHEICSNFESKYNLSYLEIKELLSNAVEEVLNYKNILL
jgi:hypothetical protein